MYFFGETVEKIGPKKYKITNGGFTTCVQPTPRWDLHADTIILNIDHYTLLRNAVFKVKGVPLLYLPILYYPTKEDDRATGFLLPTYGATTLRGPVDPQRVLLGHQSQPGRHVHARLVLEDRPGRRHRVPLQLRRRHRTATSRAYFAERAQRDVLARRRVASRRSRRATVRAPRQRQPAAAAASALAAASTTSRASRTNQTFNTNINDASRNQRTFGGNVVGAWRHVLAERHVRSHRVLLRARPARRSTGSWPRIACHPERAADSAARRCTVSVGGEYASIVEQAAKTRQHPAIDYSQDVTRLDFMPADPLPVQEVAVVHRQLDAQLARHVLHAQPGDRPGDRPRRSRWTTSLNRQFFTLQAQVIGPVFNRVWDTPDNGYAEKFKHTIEPFLNIVAHVVHRQLRSHHPASTASTSIVGGTTQLHLRHHQPVLRETAPASPGSGARRARSSTSTVTQTLLHADAARRSTTRSTRRASTRRAAEQFLADPDRASAARRPTSSTRTTSAEFDSRYLALRHDVGQRHLHLGRPRADHRQLEQARVHPATRRLQRSANLDQCDQRVDQRAHQRQPVRRHLLVQLRRAAGHDAASSASPAFYNAQCCGIAFEYQTFNFGGVTSGSADSVRSPLLHVVHARRPRQLLAVQRRDWAASPASRVTMPGAILVTGAAGFAGSHLLDLLADDGARRRRLASARRHAPGDDRRRSPAT